MASLTVLSAPAASSRPALRPAAAALSEGAGAPGDAGEGAAGAWTVIVTAGGTCWLALACLAGLPGPLAPASYADFGAAQLLEFVTAAAGYRATLNLAWPPSFRSRARVLVMAVLIALLVVVLVPALAQALIAQLRGRQELTAVLAQLADPARLIAQAQRFVPPYLLGLCASGLALAARAASRARRQAEELAGECAGARMRMLSAQLQPHFLFNALHAISVLIDDSPRRASAMIARLGDFLRHALESARWPFTDLASELAGVEAYLAVQQMRFADSLTVSVAAEPEALGACVPGLLLQPLVENAIEHGRSAGAAVLHVHIGASVVGERLCIAILNSHSRLRADLSPADFGHGLNNVEARLRAAYGEAARLTVAPDGRGGAAAFLELPRRRFWPARTVAREGR